MFSLVGLCYGMMVRLFCGRRSLLLENLALRQQLVALRRRHPRPSIDPFDKLFWVIARRVWSDWKRSLLIVTPETVVRWHRTGFRMYWRRISRVRKRVGRRPAPKEVRELIFRMVVERRGKEHGHDLDDWLKAEASTPRNYVSTWLMSRMVRESWFGI
jgi:hypothetical protein